MFTVSIEGLRRLAERRGVARIALELIQNSLDAGSRRITADLEMIGSGRRRRAKVVVEDDAPKGWVNLEDAYTLFNPSRKGSDPTQRGRFCMGEKLFIALTDSCTISSVGGCVAFADGKRSARRKGTREMGTRIEATLRCSAAEAQDIVRFWGWVIVPSNVEFVVNGTIVPPAKVLASRLVELPTEVTDAEGVLRPRIRSTQVDLVEPATGCPAYLCEMGIAIAPSGDRWHYNVHQRVPLGMDRESPGASYWRAVRAAALEAAAEGMLLSPSVAGEAWVREAMDHKVLSPIAARAFARAAFGEKAVTYDPSDREANNRAAAQGFRVVHGGSLGAQAWEHLRSAGALSPAGQVTPSAKPFSENGRQQVLRSPAPDEIPTVLYIIQVARELLGKAIEVRLTTDEQWGFRGCYGSSTLTINTATFATQWWDLTNSENRQDLEDFLIHEFGHDYESNHLSESYYKALTLIGAKFARAIREHRLP